VNVRTCPEKAIPRARNLIFSNLGTGATGFQGFAVVEQRKVPSIGKLMGCKLSLLPRFGKCYLKK